MQPIIVGQTYTARRQAYTVEKIEAGKVHIVMQGGLRLAYDERQFRDQIMSRPDYQPRRRRRAS